MTPQRHFRLVTFLLFVLVAFLPAYAQEAPLNGFDDYVNKALREWEVPGAGDRDCQRRSDRAGKRLRRKKARRSRRRSTSARCFAIGSSSKAFTAAAIAMLVDEGKLKWDDPVTKYLPEFELYDPYVTRELTVRDLLSHRSGLERGDLLWYGS